MTFWRVLRPTRFAAQIALALLVTTAARAEDPVLRGAYPARDSAAPLRVWSAIALTADPPSLINLALDSPQLPVESSSEGWQGEAWQQMPAFDQRLSGAAALVTCVRNSWANSALAISSSDIDEQR